MPIDQVKVIEIGADAIEEVLLSSAGVGLAYPPKLMHAVVAALGRHGFIIEDRYAEEAGPVPPAPSSSISLPDFSDQKSDWDWGDHNPRTAADWETSGDDA